MAGEIGAELAEFGIGEAFDLLYGVLADGEVWVGYKAVVLLESVVMLCYFASVVVLEKRLCEGVL